ncbi:MAG: tryptophan synthase subunit beta [Candidatus Aureabacteria bacterium]|nr:tryptophan synthase subunit beta [Candidatus Auribacterota bacterium]
MSILPNRFGAFGGRYVSETLVHALDDVEKTYLLAIKDPLFKKELNHLLKDFVGRPTPLYYAKNLSKIFKCKLYLKREDLAHTGAHKINNTVAQGLLAKRMGKKRIIAETGAGQHGVATAAAAAFLGLECAIYMGTEDMRRQKPNVLRMRILGADVIPVSSGSKTLKDAINEAMRDWTKNVRTTHYLFGSVLGPHPFPLIVRNFQRIIGKEAKKQIIKCEGRMPDIIAACVGGGSNAIGIFYDFLNIKGIKFIGVEAGGYGIKLGEHASRFLQNKKGIFQGTYSYLLQDKCGQIQTTHSIAPGLDYPAIGPEHSLLYENKKVKYTRATDNEAVKAFRLLSSSEGIIPALESAHALTILFKFKSEIKNKVVIINISGRGDKDIEALDEQNR